ncbi:MAG: hypothetical protein IT204_12480 [Fimbriimonadaceae bacterium]|nr:hypothetical protein [Fimbriimonadaceae bacterium]
MLRRAWWRLLLGLWVSAAVAPAATFADWVEEVRQQIPRRGAGVFRVPSEEQQAAFRATFTALAERRLAAAAELARPLHYELRELTDSATGRRYAQLVEARPWRHYYGVYFVALDEAPQDLVIEAPHPLYDVWSERGAAALMLDPRLRPAVWFMSTVHRYDQGDENSQPVASDPTHALPQIFQVAHEVFTLVPCRRWVLQIHGYAWSDKTAAKIGPDKVHAIVSPGAPNERDPLVAVPTEAPAQQLVGGLRQRGWRIWWCTRRTDPLSAGQNPQAWFSNSHPQLGPGWFTHVEMESLVRQAARDGDLAVFGPLVEAVAALPWRSAAAETGNR